MSRDIKSRRKHDLADRREALYYATSSVMGEISPMMEEMADNLKAVKSKMSAVNDLLRAFSQQYVQPEKSQNTKSPGVLVGNWFEKRSFYSQKAFQHKSVYATDYCAPPPRTDEDIMGDMKAEENSDRVLPTVDGFKSNFSTSYDLHYRIHPKGLCGPRLRTYNTQAKTWLPEQDYALNYGNITEFGLRAYKDELKRVRECSERYLSTEYRSTYVPYSREFYVKVK